MNTQVHAHEVVYARGKSAEWLQQSMEHGVPLDAAFFECLAWAIGDLKRLLQAVIEEAKKLPKTAAATAALKAAKDALPSLHYRMASECESLASDHPCLKSLVEEVIRRECAATAITVKANGSPYRQAEQRLSGVFGISAEAGILCEYVFILEHFQSVGNYFIGHLAIHSYGNRHLLANMLGLTLIQTHACFEELSSNGLLEVNGFSFGLTKGIAELWTKSDSNFDVLFCRPLEGKTLPLEEFSVSLDDIAYAKALLDTDDNSPVHILLYGPPGTGKTSFAHSLAQACGIKAWSVTSRKDDNDHERRLSLSVCLHMASRHKGSFVLVDEAERLLYTDMYFGSQTKDKAWLNELLEQPGRRVIWISNHISHIDQAVRRRFTFSIHFEELGRRERLTIWRRTLERHQIQNHIQENHLERLVNEYPAAPAVIENAIARGKSLSHDEKTFATAVECSLRAYAVLRRDGDSIRKYQAADDFSLDGVCLDGSAHGLLEKCRRADVAMREDKNQRPGCATMLFYGPPGTGKTALARYIAKTLDRECMVKRASDLFSPWVGETEQQIADAFRQAEKEGAVLVIDEADSFLYSRDIAQRSWETSFVNEFLAQLEECRAFCICTTNRRENMDAAAMRRFSYKVAFSYAKPEQVQALYTELLRPLCAAPLPHDLEKELLRLNTLTPGDFHAVRSQHSSFFEEDAAPTHQSLIAALRQEVALKVERTHCIGF